jgi:saccharopine dehydrogenase (NAD+, L-glutamate forming)
VPLNLRGYVRAGGRPSGGTFHSAMTIFSRFRQTATAHTQRRRREGGLENRRVRALPGTPHRAFGYWAVPLPTIDPQIVVGSARALERYGPDFSYGHYAAVKRLPFAVGGVAGAAALFGLAQLPPTRNALLSRLNPGDGPTPEQRAKSWFSVRILGEGDGQRAVCEVRGGDPGYGETSKMLAETALCLAFDELPPTSGQVTTAAAMGDALIERLQRAGITFTVLEQGAA